MQQAKDDASGVVLFPGGVPLPPVRIAGEYRIARKQEIKGGHRHPQNIEACGHR